MLQWFKVGGLASLCVPVLMVQGKVGIPFIGTYTKMGTREELDPQGERVLSILDWLAQGHEK